MFDTALYLYSLSGLIAETLDKVFRILYLFLLVFVSTKLLFSAFLTEYHKLIVLHFIIIDTPASYFNRTGSDIIQKSAVVTDKHHCVGTGGEEVLQPLDTLDIEMVRRLIEQQHIRTAKQQLGKLDTHTPTTGELTRRTVKILAAKAQSLKGTFYFGTIVCTAHHQKTLVFMGKTVYQFLIIFTVIIGAFGQLPVHTLYISLHLKDMLKSKFRLLHDGTLITEYHHLRQVPDRTFTGNGHNTGSGLLNAGQYFEHGGLTRPILTDKSYAVFLINNIRNVFEQRGSVKFHLQSFYRYHSVNELIV